jgi:hypothetical protein
VRCILGAHGNTSHACRVPNMRTRVRIATRCIPIIALRMSHWTFWVPLATHWVPTAALGPHCLLAAHAVGSTCLHIVCLCTFIAPKPAMGQHAWQFSYPMQWGLMGEVGPSGLVVWQVNVADGS